MGSIVGHRIDYNGVGVLRGQRHISSKPDPSTPLPPGGCLGKLVMFRFAITSLRVNIELVSNLPSDLVVSQTERTAKLLESQGQPPNCYLTKI